MDAGLVVTASFAIFAFLLRGSSPLTCEDFVAVAYKIPISQWMRGKNIFNHTMSSSTIVDFRFLSFSFFPSGFELSVAAFGTSGGFCTSVLT